MLDHDGVVTVRLEATDREAAAQQARTHGLPVLSISARRSFALVRERFALILFTQELLALLRAGLGVVEAIRALAERASGPVAATLHGVLDELGAGKPLSAALARFPHAFPPLYVETVRSAERSGALVPALARFAQYRAQVEQIRQKLISALIYPALLLAVGALVAAFLLGYVVPRFSGVYLELDKELPIASRVLFELGGSVERYWLAGALAAAALWAAVTWAWRANVLQLPLARLVRHAPVIGEPMLTYRLTQLYRTVAMLLHGGVPLVSALRMAAGLLDAASRPRLHAANAEVQAGGRLSEALARHGLTTSIAARMLQVGERSGDLAGLMEQAAAFHEDELGRSVERLTRLLEPCLMLLMGLLIGGIVVLMYMPIFDLAGTLQ